VSTRGRALSSHEPVRIARAHATAEAGDDVADHDGNTGADPASDLSRGRWVARPRRSPGRRHAVPLDRDVDGGRLRAPQRLGQRLRPGRGGRHRVPCPQRGCGVTRSFRSRPSGRPPSPGSGSTPATGSSGCPPARAGARPADPLTGRPPGRRRAAPPMPGRARIARARPLPAGGSSNAGGDVARSPRATRAARRCRTRDQRRVAGADAPRAHAVD
jgi:hypothetical protein